MRLVGRAAKGVQRVEDRVAVAMIGAGDRAVVGQRDQARAEIDVGQEQRRRQFVERRHRRDRRAAAVGEIGEVGLLAAGAAFAMSRLRGFGALLGDSCACDSRPPAPSRAGRRSTGPSTRTDAISAGDRTSRSRTRRATSRPARRASARSARCAPARASAARRTGEQQDQHPVGRLARAPGPPQRKRRADRADDRQRQRLDDRRRSTGCRSAAPRVTWLSHRRLGLGRDAFQAMAEALREERRVDRDGDRARRQHQRQPRPAALDLQPREQRRAAARPARRRSSTPAISASQRMTRPIVVGGEDQEAQPRRDRHRHAIGAHPRAPRRGPTPSAARPRRRRTRHKAASPARSPATAPRRARRSMPERRRSGSVSAATVIIRKASCQP